MTGLVASLLDQILDDDLDRAERSSTWPTVLAFLGDAVALLGDVGRARLLLPRAREYAGLNLLGAEFVAPLGSADRLIAQLESVWGMATADDHYAAAAEMDRRMEAPLHEATTLAEHAAHRRRLGAPPPEIEAVAEPARQIARARGWLRVLRLAGPAPGDAGRVHQSVTEESAATSLVDPLTPRELEVLRLVTQGLRNRDIAGRLVISEYTAANHVRSILMKTGSANRTQAARFAAVHGLLGGADRSS